MIQDSCGRERNHIYKIRTKPDSIDCKFSNSLNTDGSAVDIQTSTIFMPMCFHYSLTQKMATIEAELRVEWDDAGWQPVYHADAFSFLKMPVITMDAQIGRAHV